MKRSARSGCWALAVASTAVVACGDATPAPHHESPAAAAAGSTSSAGQSGAGMPGATAGGTGSFAGTGGAPGTTAGSGGSGGPARAGSSGSGGIATSGTAGSPVAGGGAPSGGAAGANSAGTSSAGGFGTGTLTLADLKVDANPNMTISCFVSWTTTEPATSEIDFGESDYTFRIQDPTLATSHKLLVIGMHASTSYKLKAVSGNASGSGHAESSFMTGKLPANVPAAMLQTDMLDASAKGWLLTNIQASNAPAAAVMYDEKGEPVWYYIHGTHADTRGDVSTELLAATNTVLVGPTSGEPAREVDLSGKVLWEGPAQGTTTLMSHYAGKTTTGNYLLNYELDKAVTSGSTKVDDQRLVEIAPSLDVKWSWKLFDHIPPSGNREELCHGNMLVLDEAKNILYYNCRFLGLFKIDRASGDILWRLGGTYDTTSIGPGDFTFSPASSQFSDAHEPELHADGTLLLYDNGGYAGLGGGTSNYHSRVVEYKIDEQAKTATRTFEFPGDFSGVDTWYKTSWYSPYWGDADDLSDGNILVTAPVRSSSGSTRFFEVTRQGKVVWELVLPANNGSFKAQRLLPPPLVEAIP